MVLSSRGIPCWLGKDEAWPSREVLACPSGLYSLSELAEGKVEKREPTPRFFSMFILDFDIRPDAPLPASWLAFLSQLWPDDCQSIDALQEWMGYCRNSSHPAKQ